MQCCSVFVPRGLQPPVRVQECPPWCACGHRCRNQRLQRKDYPRLKFVFLGRQKGIGVRAAERIPAKALIHEYIGRSSHERGRGGCGCHPLGTTNRLLLPSLLSVATGEVVDASQARARLTKYREEGIWHTFMMELEVGRGRLRLQVHRARLNPRPPPCLPVQSGRFIDATRRASVARFINHSCSPNAYAEKWIVSPRPPSRQAPPNPPPAAECLLSLCLSRSLPALDSAPVPIEQVASEPRVGIFAKRDISPGEEISYDYGLVYESQIGARPQRCLCGAATCRGVIGQGSGDEVAEFEDFDSKAPTYCSLQASHISASAPHWVGAVRAPDGVGHLTS